MDDLLQKQKEKLRQLRAELGTLETGPQTNTTRLRLLLLKKDFAELLSDLRKEHLKIGEQRALSDATGRAASAYGQTIPARRQTNRPLK